MRSPTMDSYDEASQMNMVSSTPTFPYNGELRRDSGDSVSTPTSHGIFMYPRNRENSKAMDIPTVVPEEEAVSPVSSPNNIPQYGHNSTMSHEESESGEASERSDFLSPTPFLNGTDFSSPMSNDGQRFVRSKRARMSTFSEWSVTLKEWLIPYSQITCEDTPIARGRYTTVYKGDWHGTVAVKLFHGLDKDELGCGQPFFSTEQLVKTFKLEVSILPSTRHENLILFLGASIEHERLFIVSTFCPGKTLDTLIYKTTHDLSHSNPSGGTSSSSLHATSNGRNSDEKFAHLLTTPESIVKSAIQIVHACAYLHNKGIIHKDLRLRNIFIELNGRIQLSDYGIFNATRLATNRHADVLFVSRSWLFCLAPELARSLTISAVSFAAPDMGLPFSERSDVFSFGCVWYELLCRSPPVTDISEDCHILLYQRGNCQVPEAKFQPEAAGMPQELCLQLLKNCWSKEISERPLFSDISNELHKITDNISKPKPTNRSGHHPVRSPSQPIQNSSSRNLRHTYELTER